MKAVISSPYDPNNYVVWTRINENLLSKSRKNPVNFFKQDETLIAEAGIEIFPKLRPGPGLNG